MLARTYQSPAKAATSMPATKKAPAGMRVATVAGTETRRVPRRQTTQLHCNMRASSNEQFGMSRGLVEKGELGGVKCGSLWKPRRRNSVAS